MAIVCKSTAEIEKMRQSGRIVRQVLDYVRGLVAPGVTTMDLERAAEKKIKELGAKPAFKGYYDYPCVLCTAFPRKNAYCKRATSFPLTAEWCSTATMGTPRSRFQ